MSSPRKTTSRPSNAKLSPNPESFNPPPMLGQTLPTRSSTPLETAIPGMNESLLKIVIVIVLICLKVEKTQWNLETQVMYSY